MGRFEGKSALVLGGSRGIGGGIARRLAREGAQVSITWLEREAPARALVEEVAAGGGRIVASRVDSRDPAALVAMVEEMAERFGLDILVSNAGMAITGPLAEYPADAFDRIFALNVRAPFLAAQAAATLMADNGRIVIIGSISADRSPGPGGTLYSASKSALGGLTRGLARDLAPRGISVNLVQPGPVDTERNPADGPRAAEIHSLMAFARHGTVDEIAGLVAYLASPEAAFITGATYNIDGGWAT